jgi:hypothetical protein
MKNFRIALFALSSLMFFACKGSTELFTSSKSSGSGVSGSSQYIDAASGGTLQLGANMTLSVPAGAIDESVEISAQQITAPADVAGVHPLSAYKFGQHGLQFHRPAQLKMCYSASEVQSRGLNEDSMAIYYNDTSGYISYGGTVDKTKHCVTTEIHHFSTYFVAAQQLLTVNTAPVIGGVSTLPSTPMAGIGLKLRSVITDFNAAGRGQVATVWLHYCVGLPTTTCGAAVTFQKVAMQPDTTSTVTTNRFTYTIPANQVTTAGITYFIEAIDNLRATRLTPTSTRTITATATGLTISPATLDISAGFSRQFTVQAVPDTGPARDIDFAQVSVGNGIGNAGLNNQGVLVFDATTSGDPLNTGFRTGTVTATLGSLSASAAVNVWPGRLTAIQLLDSTGVVLGTNIALAPGAVFDFDARGLDAFGNHSLVYPAWIVTNPLVGAIANNDGIFTASGNDGQSGGVMAIVDNIAGHVNVTLVAPPTVTLGLSSSVFSENNGSTTVSAYLSQAYASPVMVTLAFSGSAQPGDYTSSATTIIIPAGQLSGDITLTGIDNALFDGNRTVVVDIASVVNGIEAGVQQVIADTQDDETAPYVIGGTPLDGSTGNAVNTAITLNFSQPMNPATLTLSTTTACTGVIQVSTQAANFSTCIAMNAALAVMSNGDTTATLTPAAALASSTTYLVRITAAAQGANGAPLANPITSPNGFTTEGAVVTNQLNGSNGLDRFGSCIAADGDYAVIGARGTPISEFGAYTIVKKIGAGWTSLQVLPGYLYGNRNVECAISGSYVALKASQSSVAIFKNNGADVFVQTATLTGFDSSVSGFADGALGLSGDILVIGSTASANIDPTFGAAFVFQKNPLSENWDLVQRLDPPASSIGTPFTRFGNAIATNGQVIAVQSRETGKVDIFEKDTFNVWQNTGNLSAGFQDGRTLAISSTGILVIGAESQAWNSMSNVGVVHVAEKDVSGNWRITGTFAALDSMPSDAFGASVAISGNIIAVGARNESGGSGDLSTDPLFGRGAVYTFQRDINGLWQQTAKFDQAVGIPSDSDGRRADLLGASVAFANGTVLGGGTNTLNIGLPLAAQRGTVWAYPAP